MQFLTQFEQVVAETDLGQITTTYQELLAAKETWEMLTTVLSEISEGAAVVPASQIRDLFEECIDAIKTFAPAAIPQDTPADSDGLKASVDGQDEGEGESGGWYPTTREDAFQRLERIADYFEKHDPHSLVAAQIEISNLVVCLVVSTTNNFFAMRQHWVFCSARQAWMTKSRILGTDTRPIELYAK